MYYPSSTQDYAKSPDMPISAPSARVRKYSEYESDTDSISTISETERARPKKQKTDATPHGLDGSSHLSPQDLTQLLKQEQEEFGLGAAREPGTLLPLNSPYQDSYASSWASSRTPTSSETTSYTPVYSRPSRYISGHIRPVSQTADRSRIRSRLRPFGSGGETTREERRRVLFSEGMEDSCDSDSSSGSDFSDSRTYSDRSDPRTYSDRSTRSDSSHRSTSSDGSSRSDIAADNNGGYDDDKDMDTKDCGDDDKNNNASLDDSSSEEDDSDDNNINNASLDDSNDEVDLCSEADRNPIDENQKRGL